MRDNRGADADYVVDDQGWRCAVIVLRVPIWEHIPADQRVTAEYVEKVNKRRGYADFVSERIVTRIVEPQCECAIRSPDYGNLWLPCGQDVAEGAIRCKRHGGPSVRPRKFRSLEAENIALRAEIERLRLAQSDGPGDATP